MGWKLSCPNGHGVPLEYIYTVDSCKCWDVVCPICAAKITYRCESKSFIETNVLEE